MKRGTSFFVQEAAPKFSVVEFIKMSDNITMYFMAKIDDTISYFQVSDN
jgi:hypothetical protein